MQVERDDVISVVQKTPSGTAHAVRTALRSCDIGDDHLLILYGDTPLVTSSTVLELLKILEQGAAVAVCGFESDKPGYGRFVTDESGKLVGIQEGAKTGLCNGGVMALRKDAVALVEEIPKDIEKGEYYLTALVALAAERGLKCVSVLGSEEELMGADTVYGLQKVRDVMQKRLRAQALGQGVSFDAERTVFLSYDTCLSKGVHIEPYVVFGCGVTVFCGARIRSFSYLEGVTVSEEAVIGPFARVRPGSRIGGRARVGNFVELKKADIGEAARVNHLSYVGDAHVGSKANIGAGVITCNYDGEKKHTTRIGEGAFVGSNSSLVAPVEVGDGAYVGSGSVITQDVSAESLALGRARQTERLGWARGRRDKGSE